MSEIAGFTDWKNNIGANDISFANVKTIIKEHILEYWISPVTGGIDLRLDIIGDETFEADCDVTDHYVESNKAYQDQITLKPKTYTINGEVGELVWYQNDPFSQAFGQVAQKLEGVISFLPIRSNGFNQMKKTVMKASQWVDTASNAVTKLSSLIGASSYNSDLTYGKLAAMTRQQQAFVWLTFLRDRRLPMDIKTPWGHFESYVITNLEFKQPKETKDKTLISITFKEFRVTSLEPVPFDEKKYQGNAAFENQSKVDQGKTEGENVSIAKTEEVNIPIEQGETISSTGELDEVCPVFDGDGNQATIIETPNHELLIRDDSDFGGQTFFPKGTAEYNKFESIGFNQCGEALKRRGFTPKK